MAKSKVSTETTLDERINKVNALREQLKKEESSTSKEVMALLKKLMKDNPLLEAIRWQQYTPHFNDGDVCEFSTYGLYYRFHESVQPIEEKENDYYKGFLDGYSVDEDFFKEKSDILNFNQIKELEKTVKEVEKAFEYLQNVEDALQDMFGDGVEVTVTKDGVETEEYNHD